MQKKKVYTLDALAIYLDAELRGDGDHKISGLASLANATKADISFVSDISYASALIKSHAGAVIVTADHASKVCSSALICDNPYLGFAKISHLFDDRPLMKREIHETAQIANDAVICESVAIGAYSIVEAGAYIAAGVELGAGCFVGAGVKIGEHSIVAANVTFYHRVEVGARAVIHSGSVIGADGFGFVDNESRWQKINHLGSVCIGNDVEIGANTTIDRGTLDDTVIEEGVKIDNQVMVAHNVRVGKHTAIAGCVGIAGSTRIGAYCRVAGGSCIAGHLNITDHVCVTVMSFISKSITESGSYSSGTAMMPTREWKKNIVHMKKIDTLTKQVKQLEKEIIKLRDRDC